MDLPGGFQSTPSPRRATISSRVAAMYGFISIHALPAEGDAMGAKFEVIGMIFQSTPSPRRATIHRPIPGCRLCISIHALPAEGDSCARRGAGHGGHFNPRPPRGGRRIPHFRYFQKSRFQSTPSPRRATRCGAAGGSSPMRISIHALPAEGDSARWWEAGSGRKEFQSTPSPRRATHR